MATTVWKGHLTFGLVSFPVKLYTAARSESISFNQLHKADNSRIKQVIYCQAEDKPIPRSEIVKGYEYEKDRYVVIEDEDIKKMAPQTAKVMEILEFVKPTRWTRSTLKPPTTWRPTRRAKNPTRCCSTRSSEPATSASRRSPCTIASTS